eukprot:TRINITY_DN10772_c0_g2_i1.p1 TRINITY_DN10772_c0_g2~~TRINITY_DN10772_c0_g2_i1.p1  ORF type:complete len:342 (-),score=59.21 TRINITY_DN10772_c0_g2_i1:429-1454(-)
MAVARLNPLYVPFACCTVSVDTSHEVGTQETSVAAAVAEPRLEDVAAAVAPSPTLKTATPSSEDDEVEAAPLPSLLTSRRMGAPSALNLKAVQAEQLKGGDRLISPNTSVLLHTPSTTCSEVLAPRDSARESEYSETCSPSVRAACESLPNPSNLRVADSKSSLEIHLPQLTVDEMWDIVIAEDGLFQRYMREVQHFETTKTSPWVDCIDSRVRTAKVLITLPKDVPAAVRRLANIPDVAEASMAWRAVKVEGGLDIVLHNRNTEVPFGDRFIVEDVCHFRSHPDGGVTLSKKVGLVWVKPFTWSLKWLQKIIEQQVTVKSQAFDPAFEEFVRGAASSPDA